MITLRPTECTCRVCRPSDTSDWTDLEHDFFDGLARHGLQVVSADNSVGPAWSYTVGLWHLFRSPEVVVFGLPEDLRDYCLERVFDGFPHGRTPAANVVDHKVFDDAPVTYRALHPSWHETLFPYLLWTYRELPPVLQMVWAEVSGRFPWDPGFDPDLQEFQPDTWRPLDARWAHPAWDD